jgi:hypothetical protein
MTWPERQHGKTLGVLVPDLNKVPWKGYADDALPEVRQVMQEGAAAEGERTQGQRASGF